MWKKNAAISSIICLFLLKSAVQAKPITHNIQLGELVKRNAVPQLGQAARKLLKGNDASASLRNLPPSAGSGTTLGRTEGRIDIGDGISNPPAPIIPLVIPGVWVGLPNDDEDDSDAISKPVQIPPDTANPNPEIRPSTRDRPPEELGNTEPPRIGDSFENNSENEKKEGAEGQLEITNVMIPVGGADPPEEKNSQDGSKNKDTDSDHEETSESKKDSVPSVNRASASSPKGPGGKSQKAPFELNYDEWVMQWTNWARKVPPDLKRYQWELFIDQKYKAIEEWDHSRTDGAFEISIVNGRPRLIMAKLSEQPGPIKSSQERLGIKWMKMTPTQKEEMKDLLKKNEWVYRSLESHKLDRFQRPAPKQEPFTSKSWNDGTKTDPKKKEGNQYDPSRAELDLIKPMIEERLKFEKEKIRRQFDLASTLWETGNNVKTIKEVLKAYTGAALDKTGPLGEWINRAAEKISQNSNKPKPPKEWPDYRPVVNVGPPWSLEKPEAAKTEVKTSAGETEVQNHGSNSPIGNSGPNEKPKPGGSGEKDVSIDHDGDEDCTV